MPTYKLLIIKHLYYIGKLFFPVMGMIYKNEPGIMKRAILLIKLKHVIL